MWFIGWFLVIAVLWYGWEIFFAADPDPNSFSKKSPNLRPRSSETLPPVK